MTRSSTASPFWANNMVTFGGISEAMEASMFGSPLWLMIEKRLGTSADRPLEELPKSPGLAEKKISVSDAIRTECRARSILKKAGTKTSESIAAEIGSARWPGIRCAVHLSTEGTLYFELYSGPLQFAGNRLHLLFIRKRKQPMKNQSSEHESKGCSSRPKPSMRVSTPRAPPAGRT